MHFQLSQNVIDGLLYLSTEFNIDLSSSIILNSVKRSLGCDVSSNEYFYNNDKINFIIQSESAILTLYALSVKHNYDNDSLKTVLEKYEIPNLVSSELLKIYDQYKLELIQTILENETRTIPHITDIQWRLATDLKSSTGSEFYRNDELSYKINLGNFNQSTGTRNTVTEFECNTEELQALINKLKDIERHAEKLCQK